MSKNTENKKTVASKFKGTVVTPFTVRGKAYKIGDTYDAKSKKSLDYLISTKRIK